MRVSYLFLLLCISFVGCKNFEYSPNQIFDKNSYTNINNSNLESLGDGNQDDTVRFVLTGDTQRSNDETVDFYRKVNSMPGVDFVIVAGDITEFGVFKEMEWNAR